MENQAWLRSKEDGYVQSVEDARSTIGHEYATTAVSSPDLLSEEPQGRYLVKFKNIPVSDIWMYSATEGIASQRSSQRSTHNSDHVPQSSQRLVGAQLDEIQREPEREPVHELLQPAISQQAEHIEDSESQFVDFVQPLFDPDLSELFSNHEMSDIFQLDTTDLNLDYLDIEGWDESVIHVHGADVADTALGANSVDDMPILACEADA